MWAVSFAYGSFLVQNGEIEFADMMKAISAIAFGAMMLGQVMCCATHFSIGQLWRFFVSLFSH